MEKPKMIIEYFIVRNIEQFFRKHDELKCCCNSVLKEGTLEHIKKVSQKEYNDQFK